MTPEELRDKMRSMLHKAAGGITEIPSKDLDEAVQLFADLCIEVISLQGYVATHHITDNQTISNAIQQCAKNEMFRRLTKLTGKEINQ
jgi:hypothetical protein